MTARQFTPALQSVPITVAMKLPVTWTVVGFRRAGEDTWTASGRYQPDDVLQDEQLGHAVTRLRTAGKLETLEAKGR